MLNIGEELVASYLEHIKGCDFIQQNLYTPDVQGEIDVVGINLKEKSVYVCEVAIHLTTGLRYVKEKQPNNVQKLTDKFSKDIEYARKYLSDFNLNVMLWSPIVKSSGDLAKHNQLRDIEQIGEAILKKYDVKIDFIINEKFLYCMQELRVLARRETKELKCPVLRLMQIEEELYKLENKNKNNS